LKGISILGSTGSIGRQTLDVISMFPERFRIIGLVAGKNINLLKEQILKFKPEIVSVKDKNDAIMLVKELESESVEIHWGEEGAEALASDKKADLVVSSMVGASGLKPTLAAIKSQKDVALANKEILVMAGNILTKEASRNGIRLIPIDSEHSALFQALRQSRKEFVRRLILTASGGPFLDFPEEKLAHVTPQNALNHPTWKMGKKITIDSATLMNKAFEIIEASWLFGIHPNSISVWIHPQSIVHSMVEYIDGSIIAQMSIPDMRIPISYALSYPERLPLINGNENLSKVFEELTFKDADLEKYPALSLAYQASEKGGTMPAVMNAANEIAVQYFLQGSLKFIDILRVVERTMELHKNLSGESLDEIFESDKWARITTESIINEITLAKD
jgi:1-deoxy-D-xylulose-5-phosphate reductoisomerase